MCIRDSLGAGADRDGHAHDERVVRGYAVLHEVATQGTGTHSEDDVVDRAAESLAGVAELRQRQVGEDEGALGGHPVVERRRGRTQGGDVGLDLRDPPLAQRRVEQGLGRLGEAARQADPERQGERRQGSLLLGLALSLIHI